MLRSRIIPCLLLHNKGLVKTIKFKEPKYVGDPLNAVKIFNEKGVDELIFLDIDATREQRKPDFDLIEKIARECRMPFCYGGGVSSPEDAKKIINLGAEKVAINSAAVKDFRILDPIANVIGSQSVIVSVDVAKRGIFKNEYEVYLNNGTKKAGIKLLDYLKIVSSCNIGEIVVNSVDRDGTMSGYDMDLVDTVRNAVDMPITILGGASSLDDIHNLISKYKIIGAAAGSLFVFVGKYRAVLINYPDREQKHKILDY